jgi:transposase-like protein
MSDTMRESSGDIRMPECNFHKLYGRSVPASYDGPTTEGVQAYMCQGCYEMFGLETVNKLGTVLE